MTQTTIEELEELVDELSTTMASAMEKAFKERLPVAPDIDQNIRDLVDNMRMGRLADDVPIGRRVSEGRNIPLDVGCYFCDKGRFDEGFILQRTPEGHAICKECFMALW